MPTDFSGDPVWHDMITGPANTDEVTGPSVTDMGVLAADRTQFLREAMPRVAVGHETLASTLNAEDYEPIPGSTVRPTLASRISAVVTARGITISGTGLLHAVILEITAPDTYAIIAGGPEITFVDPDDIECCHIVQTIEVPAGDYCAGIRAGTGSADVVLDGVTSAHVIAAAVDPEET
jgi:hypothetical protein